MLDKSVVRAAALTCFALTLHPQAVESRKAQLDAHGQAAAVTVDDKAVAAAAGPTSYAPTM